MAWLDRGPMPQPIKKKKNPPPLVSNSSWRRQAHASKVSMDGVATITEIVEPYSWKVRYRISVQSSAWEDIEVVCDGNSTEVITEPMSDGKYKVRRKQHGYRPTIIELEDIVELQTFESTEQFVEWVETLSTDDVEAYRQIYYDLWTFDNNSVQNHTYHQILEEEKSGRKK
jgi:hypothetical protein